MSKLFLITSPFTQLNTPYPATAYLKGFLNTKSIDSFQLDLGIEVILKIFSKTGLTQIFEEVSDQNLSENSSRILQLAPDYINTISSVIQFLQGKLPSLARQICAGHFLPEASRFEQLSDIEWAFGHMGIQDQAKHLCTLYLEDLSDFIVENIDAHFGFSRYAERLGRCANQFDELQAELQKPLTFIDEITINVLSEYLTQEKPHLVCFSVPFPGNLYSSFRCAQWLKKNHPEIKIAMGGGFPNTELRDLKDPRVFDYFDFITLDDGERPIELLINNLSEKGSYKRTFLLENGQVVYKNNSPLLDYKFKDTGTPDYSDLKLDQYISVIEMANPMHSLWSDGRWNKLTMAHGCYWGKCTFCDISLDYIKVYEPIAAKIIVDRMVDMIEKTGETGFHFVDEAAPPALMKEVALEILKRQLVVSWWTNIRFEKSFTADLCQLLKASGCIAVSGGLEVASDRLLQLIQKGVTVGQVAQVTKHFTESGIMVHAYFMYGYPTQTIQETIDSLEMVRQLFENGFIQSGFWHQFAMTAHSPVGLDPEAFGVIPEKNMIGFANNDIQFKDKTNIKHEKFSFGLKKSLYNYMHGIGFDYNLQEWFDFKVPQSTIPKNYIIKSSEVFNSFKIKPNASVIWLANLPQKELVIKTKKGQTFESLKLSIHTKTEFIEVLLDKNQGEWLFKTIENLYVETNKITLSDLKKDFENTFEDFELFWFSKNLNKLKSVLLTV
jgi:radical SAM superfamily enzyme YgiQ (UPF0313 family)